MQPVERLLSQDQDEQEIQRKIHDLYESTKPTWEKYFGGAKGVITLIKDLINIDFSSLLLK